MTKEKALSLGLSDADIASLYRQLENYQENQRMMQERVSTYVSPRDVPLQYEKDIALIQRKINEIRRRLGVNAKS